MLKTANEFLKMPALFLLSLLSLCSASDFADSGRVKPIFQNGKYINPFPDSAVQKMNFFKALKTWFTKSKNNSPQKPLPVQQVNMAQAFPENTSGLYVTWLGHSSLLMQIDGMRLLIDPVFSNNISPISFIKVKRFQEKVPIAAEEIPFIDAVFISHNHYDHLDRDAILAIEHNVGYFIVPKDVGKYLRNWKIDSAKIKEFTWWEEGKIQGLSGQTMRFACTPARHFSNRSLFDRNESLWASWVFITSAHKVFYSGDGAYASHFKQIGYHYGPFDLTIMENGQYSVNWPNSHIFPELGVQAHLELKGKLMIPVHWGSFDLSIHNWKEPIERAVKAADSLSVQLLTPRIGQTLAIDEKPATQFWWREFSNLP